MTGREYHFHSYDKRYLENVVLEVEDEDTRDVTFSPEELALAMGGNTMRNIWQRPTRWEPMCPIPFPMWLTATLPSCVF